MSNYFRINIEWARRQRRAGFPNAIDVELGYGNPETNPQAINNYIMQKCGVAPTSWKWRTITKSEYDADNAYVEADGSEGYVDVNSLISQLGIKTKSIWVGR